MAAASYYETFLERHEWSKSPEAEAFWLSFYRKAFPTMEACIRIDEDGYAQRGGVDRVIVLSCSKRIKIEEKMRSKDRGDVLLELFHVDKKTKRQTPGWLNRALACDYMAFSFLDTKRGLLLPYSTMKKAVDNNRSEWWRRARKAMDHRAPFEGVNYVIFDCDNRETTCLSVSIPLLLNAVRDAALVELTP